jgi:hypothetical protein
MPSSSSLFIALAASLLAPLRPAGSSAATAIRDAGILYEVWHTPAAHLVHRVQASGATHPLTVEGVIRSDGNYTLSDVKTGPAREVPPGYTADGVDQMIYNAEPSLGFYCLYRPRPGENVTAETPHCPNIPEVAAQHAQWLTAAGFDYVLVDFSNWPTTDGNCQPDCGPIGTTTVPSNDVEVLRPLEVLAEEWLALRARGIPTPSISVWPSSIGLPGGLSPGCVPGKVCMGEKGTRGYATWRWVLDEFYNNPKFESIIYRPFDAQGKKLLMLPNSFNPGYKNASFVSLLESNGGRNDVKVISMWAMTAEYWTGVWDFFTFCLAPCSQTSLGDSAEGSLCSTTSMVDVPDCNQHPSAANTSSPPYEMTASGGYMVAQSALPFANPGHLRGLTTARLFKKVLEVGAPHLFMSSFNEHTGGRQRSSYTANTAINMGLPYDPENRSVWADTYASEFSRDLEPTKEAGDILWQVTSSCVSMYKAGRKCSDGETAARELCCTTEDKEVFANVWSFMREDSTDALLTHNQTEARALHQNGSGWVQQCNPVPGPTVFCVKTTLVDARAGPFMIYSKPVPDTTLSQGGTTRPLLRCKRKQTGLHFFSTDTSCEGQVVDQQLGYVATRRGGEMLRALYRCKGKTPSDSEQVTTHALDLMCDEPDGGDSVPLGFVR